MLGIGAQLAGVESSWLGFTLLGLAVVWALGVAATTPWLKARVTFQAPVRRNAEPRADNQRAGALPKPRLVSLRRQGRDIRSGLVSAHYAESDLWRPQVGQWTGRVEGVLAAELPDRLPLFSSDFDLPVDNSPWSAIAGLQAAMTHRLAMLDQIIGEL